MKLLVTILMVLSFFIVVGMQNKDQYFETKFKIVQLMNPLTAKALKKSENLSLFFGGMAVIAAACALAGKLGSEPHFSTPPKVFIFAIGSFGLFCMQEKRIANRYRNQLSQQALQISDEQAFYAQDIGIEAYIALQKL